MGGACVSCSRRAALPPTVTTSEDHATAVHAPTATDGAAEAKALRLTIANDIIATLHAWRDHNKYKPQWRRDESLEEVLRFLQSARQCGGDWAPRDDWTVGSFECAIAHAIGFGRLRLACLLVEFTTSWPVLEREAASHPYNRLPHQLVVAMWQGRVASVYVLCELLLTPKYEKDAVAECMTPPLEKALNAESCLPRAMCKRKARARAVCIWLILDTIPGASSWFPPDPPLGNTWWLGRSDPILWRPVWQWRRREALWRARRTLLLLRKLCDTRRGRANTRPRTRF